MATALHNFQPGSFFYPVTDPASPDILDGTDFPFLIVRFTKGKSAFLAFEAVDYGSGNLTVEVLWSADTADTGDIVMGAALAAISPEIDTATITAKALATENTVTDAHLGTSDRRLHRATITVSNLDTIAAGDWVALRLRRVDDAADTLAGDVFVHQIVVTYSTT